jgi:hypothetical protein
LDGSEPWDFQRNLRPITRIRRARPYQDGPRRAKTRFFPAHSYAGGGSAILRQRQGREPGSHPALEVRGFAARFAVIWSWTLANEQLPSQCRPARGRDERCWAAPGQAIRHEPAD